MVSLDIFIDVLLWVSCCPLLSAPCIFVNLSPVGSQGWLRGTFRLRAVPSHPSLYVDRAEFGQTASCTLVISYGGSIDRPWPEVAGEAWRRRRGAPKSYPGQGLSFYHELNLNWHMGWKRSSKKIKYALKTCSNQYIKRQGIRLEKKYVCWESRKCLRWYRTQF